MASVQVGNFGISRGSTAGFSDMMAYNQWANRPDDERYESTAALKAHLMAEQKVQRDLKVDLREMKWVLDGENRQPMLTMKADDSGAGAHLSHWAFNQYCTMAKMPTDYLRTLQHQEGSQLLLDNLSFGLQRMTSGSEMVTERRVLAKVGERSVIRAINGANFGRIFDLDLIDRIMEIEKGGWRTPPARPVRDGQRGTRVATVQDVLQARQFALSIKPGDLIAPAGTYYGDRSSFYIRVNEENPITVNGQQLFRMLIITNSEVGNGYWEAYLAYLVGICGNHILHGVQNLKAMRIRHVGAAKEKAEIAFTPEIVNYAEDHRLQDEKLFYKATKKELGVGKEMVIGGLYDKRVAPKKTLEAAWGRAEQHEAWYGAPNTAWGMASGLTMVSQESRWQDQRQEIDEAAAKVLRMAQ